MSYQNVNFYTMLNIEQIMTSLEAKHPGESEYLQAVREVLISIKDVYDRHQLLTKFFQKITGLSEDQCEENACRVEHDIDSDIVNGIKAWMQKNA